MARIVIVYHSGYGHTAVQAEAVARGARGIAGAAVQLVKVEDADQHWPDVADADAIIFGTPTYMGSASAAFKTFMDASSKPWAAGAWKDKIAAGFTNSASQSGDKLSTLQQLSELGLAFPHRFAEIDGTRAGQGASRRANTSTDRRTGERGTNQGTANRADSATDPGPAQATVSWGIAASGKSQHASDHRQLKSNAFHDRSPNR